MKFAQCSMASMTLFATLFSSGLLAAEEARIELSPLSDAGTVVIRSRDARQQLLVTSIAADGTLSDATRDAAWVVSDPAVLSIDSTGMAVPTGDGEVSVTATVGDKTTTVHVAVSGF
ncbi:MAG: hypothetical protein KDB01_26415, partial [Planctomycetaceae bacterium]|nr:hypothetical protein [Planctomycetaceae bacterium]